MARRPLLLGHRGMRGSHQVKENTIEAFDLALQHGCDGFEFDVRRSGDGRAVVCHDAKIRGVAVDGLTAEQFPELPALEQVWAHFHERAFLDIELKVAGLEEFVAKAARRFSPGRGYVISSFLPEVLQRLDPEMPKGIICETNRQLEQWPSLKVDYLIAQWKLVSGELIQKAHDAGKRIFVWTVNDAARMQRFAEWGVDGIISDDTKLLAETVVAGP